MTLSRWHLHLLSIPLKKPYRLAFGDVTHFDTIIVEVEDKDGRRGFGEATLLEAYGGGSVDGAWAFCTDHVSALCGLEAQSAKAELEKSFKQQAFAVTAMTAAIEMLQGAALIAPGNSEIRVPLLGAVSETEHDAIPGEIESLLEQGYGTLKVKVGFDVEPDLARLVVIQDAVDGRAMLRIDGNQGYDISAATRFATEADPEGIELFEQPCAADDWDAADAVAKVSRLPMMMDESIFGPGDIIRAADLGCAKFIKLKLFKMGGVEKLLKGLEQIRSLGMEPVLGNGVASDVSCWMEALVAASAITNAGELNGFLRAVGGIFEEPLAVENGDLVLPAGYRPVLDHDKIAAFTVASAASGG
ncbi:MAG: mandelate racemase [Proteobacteria bacterium]|nr:mandelate racemase [Pseudomonadota bacterium]MDA1023749.1 mandelate racemase [Pseudomonadota bacterium]